MARPLVKDLQNARGRSLVIAGEGQPAGGACAGARDERCPRERRQHRGLYTDGRNAPDGSARGARRARRRDERRHSERPAHSRWQPGLHRALGSQVRRGDGQGAAARESEPVSRRDRCALSLAHPGNTLPRDVERRPRARRNDDDRAAAHRAALQRAFGARGCLHAQRSGRARSGYDIVRSHWSRPARGVGPCR